MGLFDKLKNVLFEEEEEVTVSEPVKKVETKREVVKEPLIKQESVSVKEDIVREIPKRTEVKREAIDDFGLPTYKAEKKFDFPMFDESEFETSQVKTRTKKTTNVLEYERKKAEKAKEVVPNRYQIAEEIPQKIPFRPSPVISPVYGILDKNYKKEDLLSKQSQCEIRNNKIDVDSVRRKAFGTVEDDISETLNMQPSSFYEDGLEPVDPSKTIDELLKESADEVIDTERPSKSVNDILEETKDLDEVLPEDVTPLPTYEVLDEIEHELNKPNMNKEELENDTLESDLFDLIDSMYEQGKEG